MTDKKYTAGEFAGIAVLTPILIVLVFVLSFPLVLWSSWVAMKLWNWFPAVYFHLQPISLWMALGFMYVVSCYRKVVSYKDHIVDWKTELTSSIVGPGIVLGFGYLVHLMTH